VGHIVDRLTVARTYWISTTRPDGRPHAIPVWGVWVDGTLYHGGGDDTRRARKLDANRTSPYTWRAVTRW
jgi:hypothetical protein